MGAKATLQEATEWLSVDTLEPEREHYSDQSQTRPWASLVHSGARGAKILDWVTLHLGWVPPKADSGEDLSTSSLFGKWCQAEPIGKCGLETKKEKKNSTGYYDQITAVAAGVYSQETSQTTPWTFGEERKLNYLPSSSYLYRLRIV